MITELAVERVEFTCGHCWHGWSAEYDVLRHRDEDGTEHEQFSRDGIPVASPYSADGAPACPSCHRHWVGHLADRRVVPIPEGAAAAEPPAGHRRADGSSPAGGLLSTPSRG